MMLLRISSILLLLAAPVWAAWEDGEHILLNESYGERLPGSTSEVVLWRASSGWKVSQTRPAPTARCQALEVSAAANETEAVQLVVRPEGALTGLTAEAGVLTGPSGAELSAGCVEVLRVGYVPIERPTDRWGVAAPWPDPLPPFQGPIDVAAGANQPLWVRVHVPKGAAPGRYEGAIRLRAEGFEAEAPLHVTVYGFTLPDRMSCSTAFGYNPSTIYQYQGISDPQQKREVLDKYFANYAAHHISVYNPAPFHSFGPTWVKLGEDEGQDLPPEDRALLQEHALTPVFDWAEWDAEMERVFETYHFDSYRLPVGGLGSGTFYGRSNPSLQGFGEDTREYKLAFDTYAKGLEAHFREKGWLDKAYVYWFDEPAPRDYPFVLNGFEKLKAAAPDLRRMITDRVTAGLIGGPNIWCPTNMKYNHEDALARRAHGEDSWWYVCTVPKRPFPGLFIDHPGTDLRVWLWQTWMYGIKGILVWHSNLWTTGTAYPSHPQNPYEDPMAWMSGYGTKQGEKKPWGNGDGRFVYPPEAAADAKPEAPILEGPVDSMRWEMLRDGIEDYEYFALLKRLLEERGDELSARERRRIERLLEVPEEVTGGLIDYTKDPAPIEAHRDALARAIERLNAVK